MCDKSLSTGFIGIKEIGLSHVMTVSEIREALSDRIIEVVASRTGIHRNTIHNIRSGKVTDPAMSTVEALSRYLMNLP